MTNWTHARYSIKKLKTAGMQASKTMGTCMWFPVQYTDYRLTEPKVSQHRNEKREMAVNQCIGTRYISKRTPTTHCTERSRQLSWRAQKPAHQKPTKSNNMHSASINQTETIFICSDLKHNILWKNRIAGSVVTGLSATQRISHFIYWPVYTKLQPHVFLRDEERIRIKNNTLGAVSTQLHHALGARHRMTSRSDMSRTVAASQLVCVHDTHFRLRILFYWFCSDCFSFLLASNISNIVHDERSCLFHIFCCRRVSHCVCRATDNFQRRPKATTRFWFSRLTEKMKDKKKLKKILK